VTRIDGGALTNYGVATNGYGAYVDEARYGRLGKRDAEPGYGYYGRGYGPGIAAHPDGSSFTYRSPQGLGKREAEPGYGYGGSYQRVTRLDGIDRQLTTYGVRTNGYAAIVDEPKFGRLGKREAEPGYGYAYGPAIAAHPYGGSSYTFRGPQGLGKREAEPGYGYGGSYQRVTRIDAGQLTNYGVATNGYGAIVDEARYGRLGKREAEPAYGYGPGIAAHPYGGSSFTFRSPQGLRGKREAEPGYGYGGSYQRVTRLGGYGQLSSYGVRTNGPLAAVDEIRYGF